MRVIPYVVVSLICYSSVLYAQVDTLSINKMVAHAGRLDTDKTDSVFYYALQIGQASAKANYPFGLAASHRLMGRYYEYKDNFDSAIIEFQEYAKQGEKYNNGNQQMNAISDIAGVYMLTEQYELAKQNYFIYLQLAAQFTTSQSNLSQIYNNIAGTYQYLLNNDSAFFYYSKAIKIDEALKDSVALAEKKSNISEVLIPMGKLEMAQKYLLESLEYNERNDRTDALWYNYSNLGYVYLMLKDYNLSEHYYSLSYDQAKKTSTKTKIIQTLNGFSKLYRQTGDYKKALEYKIEADSISAILLNENTNHKIAELQEKYQSNKKEQQNIVLATQLEKETLQKRNLAIIALSFLLVSTIVAYALYINNKRKNLLQVKNNFINDQKDKLAELNLEKNSLISIVSHDLGTPIVNIQLCAQALSKKIDMFDADQVTALNYIKQSAEYGYQLIQNILSVETAETGHHKMQLEEIQLQQCVDEMKNDFAQAAAKKQIKIHTQVQPTDAVILTDKFLLKRILSNLVSNALKFSAPQKNVWIAVQQQSGITTIMVKDEGPGISKEDQQRLFAKYARLTNLPTANEPTTGLGLHIVKRIVMELNGKITVASTPGKGAEFKVILGGVV